MGLGIFFGDVHDAVCGLNARGCEVWNWRECVHMGRLQRRVGREP